MFSSAQIYLKELFREKKVFQIVVYNVYKTDYLVSSAVTFFNGELICLALKSLKLLKP